MSDLALAIALFAMFIIGALAGWGLAEARNRRRLIEIADLATDLDKANEQLKTAGLTIDFYRRQPDVTYLHAVDGSKRRHPSGGAPC